MIRSDHIDVPSSFCGLLKQVGDGLRREIERNLAERGLGLNFNQCMVLRTLMLSGPCTAIEIAQAIDHTPGAVMRLLDKLEARGCLHRKPHGRDRRALRIVFRRRACVGQEGARMRRESSDAGRRNIRCRRMGEIAYAIDPGPGFAA
ncbi:MAG: MarR family transcriptional regulator [Azoarcus sp.]|nr:MarR family transcriptional regulator [Azoarcus sp.]